MTLPASQSGDSAPVVHHRKPRQLAKRLESLVSISMAVVAGVLLIVGAFAIIGGGPQVPPWLR